MHDKERGSIDYIENNVGGNFNNNTTVVYQADDVSQFTIDALLLYGGVSFLLRFVLGTAQSQNDGGW